ncbi:MAG: serine hydrolase [Gemmatimonadetes bacterium]|nr:MAG: serine hydrolase [Gemmatimonadota bacterium]
MGNRLPSATLTLLLAGSPLLTSPAAAQARLPRRFDADVARALREFQVPGAAIAIVKDGRVVLAKGYGVRRLGDPTPVDAHTLFQIASNTKAFATACLALLADSGKLAWVDRVTKYLPDFQLADPWVTREFTIEDLVTHRSGLGLGAGDLLWLHSTYGRAEIIRRLRAAPPVSSFRSQYAYDNVLYAAAGEIVPAVTGKTWETFVRDRILTPLGMTETRVGVADLRPGDPFAAPHAVLDGRLQIVPLDTVDNIAPAAALISSVTDLSRWLLVQLDSGRAGVARLWTARRTREMWSAQTILPIADPDPPLAALRPNFAAYGLGWRLRDYRGHKIVWHTGALAGMASRTTLVPDQRLGIVILTNGENDDAHDALTYELLDHFFGAPATDWIKAFDDASQQTRSQVDSALRVARRTRDSTAGPSLPLARYAGRYTDALYGDATITLEQGTLVLRFSRSPAFVGDLAHWQYDTFRTGWRTPNLADAFVTFDLNPDGSIVQFRMAAVSPLADFSFDYQDLRFVPAADAGGGGGGRR